MKSAEDYAEKMVKDAYHTIEACIKDDTHDDCSCFFSAQERLKQALTAYADEQTKLVMGNMDWEKCEFLQREVAKRDSEIARLNGLLKNYQKAYEADGYEKLKDENARLKEALGKIASEESEIG